jgi:hypothetical protein
METTTRDDRTYATLDELQLWEDNPRSTHDADLERLADHLTELGQFKPLLCTEDGTVIGGNQRLKAMREMGWDDAWVAVIDPDDEDEMMEIAMADNDRAGYYDEERMADLLSDYDVDVSRFKIDFYAPQDLASNLAGEMNPEDLLDAEGGADSDGDGDGDGSEGSSGDGDDEDVTPRNMEHLGEQTATQMVQLFMTESAKEEFQDDVTTLKSEYEADTTSDVVKEAVRREAQRAADDDEAELIESDD